MPVLETDETPRTESHASEGAPSLLVGYDASEGGRDALELARIFHSMLGGRVLVASAASHGPAPGRHRPSEGERAAVEALFEQARLHIGLPKVEARALAGGSPAKLLIECAEVDAAQTLVLGSPHRGVVGRALIGSVAKGVLYGAPCEVVVAPRGYADRVHVPYRTIAVAYDGSEEAEAALRRAEDLARPNRASIEILTVAEAPVTPATVWGGIAPAQLSDPDKILNGAIESVDERLAVQGRRLEGEVATTLARACENSVDLLVAGSRGYGPAARVLLGSVTGRLIQDAPCPVLVVPRAG